MSKKYKGKTCAYCAVEGSSTSEDHVFARKFFPEERRANLPKVPACEACNNAKSKLETNLIATLPFGATHKDAKKILSMVPNRLAKNKKLHRELASGMKPAWIKQDNLILPSITLNISVEQLQSLVRYIVRGLVCYHWQIEIPDTYHVSVGVWTQEGEQNMLSYLPSKGKSVVEENYGDGAVEYKGIQAIDDPFLSLWRLKLYGGLKLGGADNKLASPNFWAISSSKPMPSYFMT